MTQTPENRPWVKPLLELGPVILFFAVFMWFRGEIITVAGRDYTAFVFATLVFIPALILASLAQWRLTGRLPPMQIATLVLVIVFGGLSVWLNDPRFFKMKPTMIYLLFALALGFAWMTQRNWLGAVLSETLPMTDAGWRILTLRMAMLFLGLAVLNEIVWRNLSETDWVYFKTFGLPLIMFAFLMANARLYKRHGIDKPKGDGAGGDGAA